MTDIETITTPRLELVSMSVPFMRALARRDLVAATRELGADVPLWMAEQLENFVRYRLGQLEREPEIQEWLGRAIVLPAAGAVDSGAGERRAIGSIGFHGPPDEHGRLEIGYSVDPRYRRQGYAREAVRAMFDWAYSKHAIGRFVASVSPDNQASLNLIRQFGFERVGEQMDEIDGLEYVFETSWPPGAD